VLLEVVVIVILACVETEIDLPTEVVSLRTHSLDLWSTSKRFTYEKRIGTTADFGVFSTA
jgi:hypothetical protein